MPAIISVGTIVQRLCYDAVVTLLLLLKVAQVRRQVLVDGITRLVACILG